jgi:hypothetical protein
MATKAVEHESTEERPQPTVTFARFLEEFPANSGQEVLDFYVLEEDGSFWRKHPQLRLWCRVCQGHRRFDGGWREGGRIYDWKKPIRDFLVYKCRDCDEAEKTFCLLAIVSGENGVGLVRKLGEHPELHIDVPTYLRTLLGDEYEYFLKGLRAEKQGLGIGAFSYYRRVVENQKGRIFQKMAEVAKRLDMPSDMIENLIAASKEPQFSKALEIVKDYIPNEFKLSGNNPMKTLYAVISDGLHDKDDEACLQIAHSVRVVIQDMSQRMKDALRDDAEAKKAFEDLLKRHSGQA